MIFQPIVNKYPEDAMVCFKRGGLHPNFPPLISRDRG